MRSLASMALASCLSAQAQVNFPFADSAATWVQYFEQMVTPPPFPQFDVQGLSNICINGPDTVIAGTTYRKVEQCNAVYIGALRQDPGQVFFVPADSSQAYLLYDFSLTIGDTAHDVYVDDGLAFSGASAFPSLVDYVVDQVGEVAGRKWLRLRQPWGGPEQVWIEGFGSPYGLFSQQDPINVSGYWYGIACMSHLDTIWYFNEWEIDPVPESSCTPQYVGIQERDEIALVAYPNPTSDKVWLRTDGITPYSISVTDQLGRVIEVTVRLSPGGEVIDLTEVSVGMYFVSMSTSKGSTTIRVLKQ
jgi:hypothetical protein